MLVRYGAFAFFLLTCRAQNLSVGFAGGGPLSEAFEAINAGVPQSITSYSQRNDYVVGLTLEYRLPGNLSIEGDALYRELHLTVAFVEPNLVLNSVSPSPVVTWELPLMAKYRFHWAKADPFVEAGPAFRPTTNLNANPSHYGITAGIGVAAQWKQFEIAPMVRYSRWIHDRSLSNLAESRPDQLELLLAVTSRPRSPWHPLSRRIALGVIGGTTLFHDVPSVSTGNTYASGSNAPLIGPAMDASLSNRFSIEADAIYHPIEVSRRSLLANGEVINRFSGAEGRTFEFPVFGKYKFGAGQVRPFIEGGPSFRLLTENSSLFGISAGGGLEVHLKALKIAPTLRFTHWGQQGYHSAWAEVAVNQVEFLTAVLL
jgi:hypothetical protein